MDDSYDRLIGALAADLRPVRRLPPPALRALFWLALVAAVAAALATFRRRRGDVASPCREPRHVACGAWIDRDCGDGGVRCV